MKRSVRMKTRAFVVACIACLVLLTMADVSGGADWAAMPSGTTQHLTAIWGSSASDVFAVGTQGTIQHFDGLTWSSMASGTTADLWAIWGSSANDVFAIGNGGTILHFDGSMWSAIPSGTTGPLTAIWGSSASDVFAVGFFHTILLHFDGSTWLPMTMIVDGTRLPSNTIFGSIWGTSSSNVFVAGFYQDIDQNAQLGASHFLILHYDGSAWTTMVSQTSGGLGDIWGSSSSDIYAFGLGLHYDGSAWTKVGGLLAGGDAWGLSPNDIYLCGDGGRIVHFNGTASSPMVSGTSVKLAGIWGSSSLDLFVVGNGGTILRRSCTPATPDPFVFLNRTGAAVNSVAAATAEIHVSGICSSAPISVAAGEYSVDGGAYTSLPGTVNNGNNVKLRLVSSASPATAASATLTIGDTSGAFTVTTQGPRGETRRVNDFDGDGCSEIGCYDPASSTWFQYRSQEGYWTTPFGFAGTIPVTGDFDGDGRADVGAFYPPLGNWYIFRSTEGFWQTQFGYEGTLPVVGDFDGDGRDDFGVYYPPAGAWYLFKSAEGFFETRFGFAGTIPVVGDFDGDGRDDFGVYYPPAGAWHLFKSTKGYSETAFGYPGTIPFVGDFDGDGRDDIGLYDSVPAQFGRMFLFKSTEGFWQANWTTAAEPVVGDFDCDGRDDVGLYTARVGEWDLARSAAGLGRVFFGFAGTIPLGYVIR